MAGIVVVGAGVAGLVCAWRLQRAGHEVVVLEQEAASGGRLRSFMHAGHRIHSGAGFVTDGQRNVLSMAAALGLADELLRLEPGSSVPGRVLRGGRFEPCRFAPGVGALRSPVLAAPSRVRMGLLAADLFRHRDRLDPVQPERAALLDDGEDMARYVTRLAGDAARDRLVSPFVSTLYGCEPEAVGAAAFLLLLRSLSLGASPVTLRGGLARLTETLAGVVPVRNGCEVFSVETERTGARVRYRSLGRERSFLADAAVLAVPGPAVPQLCPTLSRQERAFFEALQFAPGIQVDLLLDTFSAPLAYGNCFPRSEATGLRSVFLAHREPESSPPGQGHLVVHLAEPATRRLARAKDEEVAGFAIDALARTPIGLLPSHEAVVQRWQYARPTFPLGALARLEGFDVRIERSPRLAFAGDYLVGPTVDGAVTSGMRAASRIVQSLDDTGLGAIRSHLVQRR